MIQQNPILIAGPPRSGTTMIAGLLNHQGVWIGQGRTTHYPGTNPEFVSENQEIKNILKSQAQQVGYKNWSTPLPTECTGSNFKNLLEQIVPEGSSWLIKTSWTLIFSDLFIEAYPEARWVLPKRNLRKVLDSMNRHPGMRRHPNKEKKAFIRALQARQSIISSQVDKYINIDVEAISKRDSAEIERLFIFLGMTPDWEIINKWIDPKIMCR